MRSYKGNKMKKKNTIKMIALLLLLGIGAYLFQAYGVAEKFGRFVNIMSAIIHNLQHDPHENALIEITDEELREVNVTSIAKELRSSIDRKKAIAAGVESLPIEADEIREEEKPTHTKVETKAAKLLSLEDLPAKFKPLKQFLHEPFKMGACQICHIADSNKPGRLVKKEIKDICYECHKTRYTQKFDHLPVKDGRCVACHDPHQSDTKMLLKAENVNALCLNCHERGSTYKEKAKKQLITMKASVQHKPATKSCLECHDPHTAEHKSLLHLDAKMDLCLDCHDDISDTVKHAGYKHGAVTESKKRCLECHDPHATDHKNILKKDPVSLCLNCHDKELKAGEDGGMLMNMKEHLKQNPNWHKPIKDVKNRGGCSACHASHGSDNFSILRQSFTKNFYDNFDNKEFFCFKCHEQKKITMQYIGPEDANITSFRDGDVNLHHLHVNDRKGRSCRACHDEHASKYSHLIRDYTDFSGIKYPLRYVETPNGGSCAPACHKKFAYDRIDPQGIGR